MVNTANGVEYSMSFYETILFPVATDQMALVVGTPLVKQAYAKIKEMPLGAVVVDIVNLAEKPLMVSIP